jgi:hypothetical protein
MFTQALTTLLREVPADSMTYEDFTNAVDDIPR